MRCPIAVGPSYQPTYGGISQTASSASSSTIRFDVVVLERRHIVGEQSLRVLVVERLVWVLRVKLVHLGPGALQAAVDRGRRHVQQFGYLAGLPREDVTQDQDRTLGRRQMLQALR